MTGDQRNEEENFGMKTPVKLVDYSLWTSMSGDSKICFFLRKSTFPCSNNEHVKSILDFFVSLFSLLFEKTESNVNNEDNTVE